MGLRHEEPPKASEPAPEYYEQLIGRHTWWTNKERSRQFVIAYVHYTDDGSPGKFRPNTVGILELHKEDPVERPWPTVVDLVKAGELVKTSQPT